MGGKDTERGRDAAGWIMQVYDADDAGANQRSDEQPHYAPFGRPLNKLSLGRSLGTVSLV